MALGAVLVVFIVVLVGVMLLAEVANLAVLRRMKLVHVGLAAVATVMVCAAGFSKGAGVAWLAAIAVVVAGLAGIVTWRRSIAAFSGSGNRVSPSLLLVHGTAALATLVLIVVAAALRD